MNIRHLSVLAYVQGFTLSAYRDWDARLADMTAPGFFAGACDMLEKGDVIFAVASDGVKMVAIARTGDAVETESVA